MTLPALRFANLKHISPDTLTGVFNDSFAGYFVPFQLNTEQLERKLINDAVDLELSAGAFDGDMLVGFMLHGTGSVDGVAAVYNAGTGVLPAYRGRQATKAMYRFILPELRASGAKKALLEVIDRNEAAFKSYTATGYTIHRELLCFRGIPQLGEKRVEADIREIAQPDWSMLQAFRDWQPSWQNTDEAVRRSGVANRTIGIYEGGKIVAYACYSPLQKRVAQFAVDKACRGRGLGRELLRYISEDGQVPCTLINIPGDAGDSLAFLRSLKLEHFVTQYEMCMPLV